LGTVTISDLDPDPSVVIELTSEKVYSLNCSRGHTTTIKDDRHLNEHIVATENREGSISFGKKKKWPRAHSFLVNYAGETGGARGRPPAARAAAVQAPAGSPQDAAWYS
jgi:hypothetical protein